MLLGDSALDFLAAKVGGVSFVLSRSRQPLGPDAVVVGERYQHIMLLRACMLVQVAASVKQHHVLVSLSNNHSTCHSVRLLCCSAAILFSL
jgi:hypothetical protein